MVFGFLGTGRFNVVLGKTFESKPKKKAQKFFNVKNNHSSDPSIFGEDAKLEKKNDRYEVEMKHAKKPNVTYDAEITTEEEYNCILIYNEETKTFTLERQSAHINLTPRKPELSNGHLNNSSPLPDKQFIHTPPIAAVVTPKEMDESSPPADDFDFDISKDMDDILDSDDGSDSAESQSDVFEEIEAPAIVTPMTNGAAASPLSLPSLPASPNIPMNLALPTTPMTNTTPGGYSSSASANGKKRKLKMASAPIRHPGIVSPLASTPPITNTALHISPTVKRIKTSHEDDSSSSSSGSEDDDSSSGSGSESGSTETGSSSESGSDSDSDMDSLAQDISISLSKGGPSAPASPLHQPTRVNTPGMPSPSNYKKSPYETHSASSTPTPTARQTQPSTNAGPMSLRALFKDDEEESLSSSESEDDD